MKQIRFTLAVAALYLAGCATEKQTPGPIDLGGVSVEKFPQLAIPAETPDTKYLLRAVRVEIPGEIKLGKLQTLNQDSGTIGGISHDIFDEIHAANPRATFKIYPVLHLVPGKKSEKENGVVILERNQGTQSEFNPATPENGLRHGVYFAATVTPYKADSAVDIHIQLKDGRIERWVPTTAGDFSSNLEPICSVREIETKLTLYPNALVLVGSLSGKDWKTHEPIQEFVFVELGEPTAYRPKSAVPTK